MQDLFVAPLSKIRPTQAAVGEREVANKFRSLSELDSEARDEYLKAHPVPVIAGPDGYWYALDRHHLGCAVDRLGLAGMYGVVHAELEWSDVESCLCGLFHRGWCYPYNGHGERCSFLSIPKRFHQLVDDPYRSLAGMVRHRKAFGKTTTPFSEFRWADYFRRVIPVEVVSQDFAAAVEMAVSAAGHPDAALLPGFIAGEIH
jgi:hypothetical protein